MTLQQIDNCLASWKARLGAIAHNLVDLQSHPAYEQIAAAQKDPKARLSGETAARVTPALAAMNALFQWFTLLEATIERAGVMRQALPSLFVGEQRLREIEAVLLGHSIHLPRTEIPVEERGLLSAIDKSERVAPEALLNAMGHAYENAKAAVFETDAAWQRLAREMRGAHEEIDVLRQRAGGDREQALDLDEMSERLEELRGRLQSDPLGASATFDGEVQPAIAAIRSALDQRDAERKQFESRLAAARSQWRLLCDIHAQARSAFNEAREKTSGPRPLSDPQPDDRIAGLGQWLESLEKRYSEGLLQPIRVGLRNWETSAQDCLTASRALLNEARGRVEARKELRGRLDALKAKARAYGVAESDDLRELASAAERCLYTRPTALADAGTAVAEYETRLSGRTAKMQRQI